MAVFGIGGVGGYVVEALARGGIGELTLIDNDTISLTNLNRQIVATREHIGKYKTDVMKERVFSINPEAKIHVYHSFFLPGIKTEYEPLGQYSYVVDAIDTVTAKIELAVRAQTEGFSLISSMGTGNKLDPTAFIVSDIYETKVCPLAKVMRKELKERNVKGLKVVYSQEVPMKPTNTHIPEKRSPVPGSVSFVPATAGLIIAGEVMKDLIGFGKTEE